MLYQVIKRYPNQQVCMLFLSNPLFPSQAVCGFTVVFLQDASNRLISQAAASARRGCSVFRNYCHEQEAFHAFYSQLLEEGKGCGAQGKRYFVIGKES